MLAAAGLALGVLQGGGAKGIASMLFGGSRAAMKGYGKAAGKYPRATKGLRNAAILGAGGMAINAGISPFMEKRREWYNSKYGEEKTTEYYDRGASSLKSAGTLLAVTGASVIGATVGAKALGKVGRAVGRGMAGNMTAATQSKKIAKSFVPGWKSAIGIGAAAGVGAGSAMARANPRNRPAKEGMISGIRSAPMGGISPELQFSTQGLTLGIHNTRSRRIV